MLQNNYWTQVVSDKDPSRNVTFQVHKNCRVLYNRIGEFLGKRVVKGAQRGTLHKKWNFLTSHMKAIGWPWYRIGRNFGDVPERRQHTSLYNAKNIPIWRFHSWC